MNPGGFQYNSPVLNPGVGGYSPSNAPPMPQQAQNAPAPMQGGGFGGMQRRRPGWGGNDMAMPQQGQQQTPMQSGNPMQPAPFAAPQGQPQGMGMQGGVNPQMLQMMRMRQMQQQGGGGMGMQQGPPQGMPQGGGMPQGNWGGAPRYTGAWGGGQGGGGFAMPQQQNSMPPQQMAMQQGGGQMNPMMRLRQAQAMQGMQQT